MLDVYYVAAKSDKEFTRVTPNVHSFGEQVSHVLSNRIGQLCGAVVNAFVDNDNNHYIYEVGKKIYSIEKKEDQFSYVAYKNQVYLMASLSKPSSSLTNIMFDDHALKTSPLPIMFSINRKNVIQMFLQKMKTSVELYVVDEMG